MKNKKKDKRGVFASDTFGLLQNQSKSLSKKEEKPPTCNCLWGSPKVYRDSNGHWACECQPDTIEPTDKEPTSGNGGNNPPLNNNSGGGGGNNGNPATTPVEDNTKRNLILLAGGAVLFYFLVYKDN